MMLRKQNLLLVFFIQLIILFGVGCKPKSQEIIEIDFSKSNNLSDSTLSKTTSDILTVAVSTMISPKETYNYYQDIFKYLSEKIGKDIKFIQRETYKEVNDLLINNQVDIAFICTGAYLENQNQIDLLVVPVCYGKPYYQAYIIVNKQNNINQFEQLKNKTFAYTDPLSNTGKIYAENRVAQLGYSETDFFSKIIYSGAHDISIQLVSNNLVDGATVDGLVYDYILKNYPERLSAVKIIEKSKFYGIPPIVCSTAIDKDLKANIQNAFVEMDKSPNGRSILEQLLIDKFIVVSDTLYDEN